jgi:hypothetical protein
MQRRLALPWPCGCAVTLRPCASRRAICCPLNAIASSSRPPGPRPRGFGNSSPPQRPGSTGFQPAPGRAFGGLPEAGPGGHALAVCRDGQCGRPKQWGRRKRTRKGCDYIARVIRACSPAHRARARRGCPITPPPRRVRTNASVKSISSRRRARCTKDAAKVGQGPSCKMGQPRMNNHGLARG